MHSSRKLFAMFAGLLIGTGSLNCAAEDSPIGYWKTFDDVSGKPRSIVQISQTKDQGLIGKIVKLFPVKGNFQASLCTACIGKNHNLPIVGMQILTGLKADEKVWDAGKILNPVNGKSYNCSLRLSDGGKRLRVHDYIGLPLFGRSETWERVDLMAS